jgi:hypothetical protein
LSGLLFLSIIVTNIVSSSLGNELFSDLDSRTKLEAINNDPGKFRMSVWVGVLEHLAIVSLAVSLFNAFGGFNQTLGYVWLIARILEGLILLFNETRYWSLQDIARRARALPKYTSMDLRPVPVRNGKALLPSVLRARAC